MRLALLLGGIVGIYATLEDTSGSAAEVEKGVAPCRRCKPDCGVQPRPPGPCPIRSTVDYCTRQEFQYEFLTPKANRKLIVKNYCSVEGQLEIFDMNTDIRIYTSRHPGCGVVSLVCGPNKLRFVYKGQEISVPLTSLSEPGCPCDSMRSILRIGPFRVFWCAEKSPFFPTIKKGNIDGVGDGGVDIGIDVDFNSDGGNDGEEHFDVDMETE